MHGSVLASFRNYVTERFGAEQWQAIARAAGTQGTLYVPSQIYPDGEALALFDAAAAHAGTTGKQLQEQFGEYLAPSFLKLYGAMIPHHWTTLEFAENSASVVHRVIRMRNAEAGPPKWSASRPQPDTVRIDYHSRRNMCGLFIGVMRGFAGFRNETVEIRETACMREGAEACLIELSRSAAA